MLLYAKRKELGLVMEQLYMHLGITRQSLHKRIKRQALEDYMMEQIQSEVKVHRQSKERRAGSRNLFFNLAIKEKYTIGITKFERLLSSHGLTLKPLKVRIITTQSSCQSWNYSNLINGLEINGINQAVVGDITYITLGSVPYYLFGLTDLYSARSVGISVSDRMRTEDASVALEGWITLRHPVNLQQCIHHTDGGGQYFSKTYLSTLSTHQIQVSVAENCLQNGYAEQRNGFIKNHLLPTRQTRNLNELKIALQEIIYFYNYERKQEGLGWLSPVEFESYVSSLQSQERPKMRLYDFENMTKGFLRYKSTKS